MKQIYLFLISIIISFQLTAQITIIQNGKKEALPNMVLQVKQLDEFVNRFNYEQNFYGKKITLEFTKQFPRGKYISLLFNNQDKRMVMEIRKYELTINDFR